MSQLYLSSQAAGSDCASWLELIKFSTIGHEGISRVFPFGYRTKIDSFGELEGNILHAVNGDVDASRNQGFIEFLRKKPLASDFCKRHIENSVPGSFH